MTIIPLSADTYYEMKWLEWVHKNICIDEGCRRWGSIVRYNGTSSHYVDLFIEDPELAVLFRLATGI